MALADLIEKWQDPEDCARRTEAKKLLDFQIGNWRQQLKDHVRARFAEETFHKLKLNIDDSWNISEFACSKIGAIYSGPVKRSVNGVDLMDSVEGKIYLNGGMLDLALGTACPLTLGVGNVFLRPMGVVDPVSNTMSMVVDIITPEQCVITESDYDPNDISEILYCVGKGENAHFVYWSLDWHATLDSDFNVVPNPKNPNNINPYGLMPFVALRETYRIKHFFQARTGKALRQITLTSGEALTNFAYRLKTGCFKQPVVIGEPGKDFPIDHILDSVTPLVIGQGGSYGVLDVQNNFQGLFDTLVKRASTSLVQHGFTDEALKGVINSQSGIALRVKQVDLNRAHKKQQRLYTFFEGELYEKASVVLRVDLGIQVPQGQLEIEFPDIGPQASPVDLMNVYGPQVDRGMIPKWYAVMKVNGISEEMARQLVAEAREETPPEMLPLIPSDVQMIGTEPSGAKDPGHDPEENENLLEYPGMQNPDIQV